MQFLLVPLPGGLDPPVRDGGAGLALGAEALRVDNILARLGCDVFTELGGVARWQLEQSE